VRKNQLGGYVDIKFNAGYLELIKNLTSISPGIIFVRDEETKKIVVARTNKGRSIFFKVEAPEDYFTFSGDKVAFYNFGEFYQLIGAFGASKLSQTDNKIVIESAIGRINYVLSAPETLSKSPTKVNITDPDIVFNLSAENLAELKKINSLMNAKYANITNVSSAVTFKLFNNVHDNSFDKTYTPEIVSKNSEDFNFPVYSEIFSKIPSGINYKVSLFKKGFVFFSCIKDDVDFLAVTSRVKKIGDSEGDGTPES
jgi:hypothetical protein